MPKYTRDPQKRVYLILMRFLIPLLLLTACTQPNHLGNPLTLPIRAVLSGVENASYASKRAAVKQYISEHQAEMIAARFAGPHTKALFTRIDPNDHAKIRNELTQGQTRPDFPEYATIIIMVHQP